MNGSFTQSYYFLKTKFFYLNIHNVPGNCQNPSNPLFDIGLAVHPSENYRDRFSNI